MKDIYELLNDIDIDENEFEEMKVSEIEKARIKKRLREIAQLKNNEKSKNTKNSILLLKRQTVIINFI